MTFKFFEIRDRWGSVKMLNECIEHIKKDRMKGFVIGMQGEVDDEMRDKYPETIFPGQSRFTNFYFCGEESCLNLIGMCHMLIRKIEDYIKGEGG